MSEWRGPVVLVLAGTVAVSITAAVVAVVTGQLAVSASGIAWLASVLGALVAIVGGYVAGRRPGRGGDHDGDDPG